MQRGDGTPKRPCGAVLTVLPVALAFVQSFGDEDPLGGKRQDLQKKQDKEDATHE